MYGRLYEMFQVIYRLLEMLPVTQGIELLIQTEHLSHTKKKQQVDNDWILWSYVGFSFHLIFGMHICICPVFRTLTQTHTFLLNAAKEKWTIGKLFVYLAFKWVQNQVIYIHDIMWEFYYWRLSFQPKFCCLTNTMVSFIFHDDN